MYALWIRYSYCLTNYNYIYIYIKNISNNVNSFRENECLPFVKNRLVCIVYKRDVVFESTIKLTEGRLLRDAAVVVRVVYIIII